MTILDLVGNTPLIELSTLSREAGVSILAKGEFRNPSGSVKDRAAKAMILDGIEGGLLRPGMTIIDASSGNTGIAYAMMGALLGYGVKIYLPANTSDERKNCIRHYGARIVETDPLEGSDGAFLAARDEAARGGGYFYPDQYHNEANWRAHYDGTAPEIWGQTGEGVTHFVAGTGTSGTLMGTGRRLKEYNPAIRVYAVQPDSPFHGIEGTRHMASAIVPGFYDPAFPDGVIETGTEEAYAMCRLLAREEGIQAGISSGANVSAAVKLARGLPPGSVVVTILCDGGSRYLNEPFWNLPEPAVMAESSAVAEDLTGARR